MLKKSRLTSLVLLTTALLLSSCSQSADERTTESSKPAPENIQVVTLDVHGMTCSGCEFNVKSALKKLDGVQDVDASYEDAAAVVKYDPEKVQLDQLIESVNSTGYKASVPDHTQPEGE